MTHRPRVSFLPCLLFLCFHLLHLHPTSGADPNSLLLQDVNCSTPGNYTATSAYAANLNQFLAAVPENAVAKNGGFYNGTVGEGMDTVYCLAMCPADYSRAACGECLTAATTASNGDSLLSQCLGSTTVLAMFERCLIRYSDVNFFGSPEVGVVKAVDGETLWMTPAGVYGPEVAHSLKQSTDDAILVPQLFAANSGAPFVLVQCTRDLSADKCKQCLDELTANATDMFAIKTQGQRKSYSCAVRYSNTRFMVVPFTPAPPSEPWSQSIDPSDTSTAAGGGHGRALIMGGVVALVFTLMVVVWSIVSWCMCTQTRDSFGSETTIKRFAYRDLCIATDWFSKKNKIGEGGVGMVYKGCLKNENVAIKRIAKDSSGDFKDFLAELVTIGQTGHGNVVRLKGWCCSISNFMFWWSHKQNVKLFLIYELVTNGNLHYNLHESKDVLPWAMRYKIVKDTGTALHYLHHQCSPYIFHSASAPVLLPWTEREGEE